MAPLPVTLISGFLGSGKTTLLKHILRNTHGLRCAVLVNDMAELNIDAAVLKGSKLVRAEEGFVEMQNGCICCTLREDFVAELTQLAASGKYEYLVIESTGIAEPMQVAEAFAVDMADGDSSRAAEPGAAPLLHELVRLDTCVTVVDAATLMANFSSLESIKERGGEEEEERNVSDLLLDGIEFAEVILLNKVDLVSEEEGERLLALLRTLNPQADVIPTVNSVVELGRVIGTRRFSFDKAAKVPGWLKTLQQPETLEPETLEYGISSFVYRSRRPFHPQRLHAFIDAYALLQEPEWEEEEEGQGCGEDHEGPCDHGHHHHHHHHVPEGHYGAGTGQHHTPPHRSLPDMLGTHASPGFAAAHHTEAVSSAVAQASAAAQQAAAAVQSLAAQLATPQQQSAAQLQANAAALAAAAAAASAAAASAAAASLLACQLQAGPGAAPAAAATSVAPATPARPSALGGSSAQPAGEAGEKRQYGALGAAGYGQVLRSKGFIWLATRPDICGEWSQAGGVLQLGVGGPWYCVLPDSEWPAEEEHRAEIRKDFREPHGDRRQELVFIGIGVDRDALSAALDACLASDEELAAAGRGELPDPFAKWPSLQELLEDDDEEEEEGLDDLSEGEAWPAPVPGRVHDVFEGAAEVQALLDATPARLAVVSWHAGWCAPCEALAPGLERLAAQHAGQLLVLRLDVEASPANQALALEKVMERPSSRRQGAKPVLRGEEKFPCLTLHTPPSLQPEHKFTGPTALADLLAHLAAHMLPAPTPAAAERPASSAQAAGSGSGAAAGGVAPAAGGAAAPAAGRLVVLKKGAAEAKELLGGAKAAGRPVVVVWSEPESEASAELVAAAEAAAENSTGVLFVEACPGVSKANALLAQGLKVAALPTVHVYRDMALSSKLEGPGQATPDALARLVAELAPVQGPANGSSTAAATGAAAVAAQAPAPAGHSASAPAESQQPGAAAAGSSIYDPPGGKYARPGATKRLEDGRTVHFFPKMPCLKCGCPWWTSDEWDARCIRCGWDCESGGYDDNSQPLPKYRPRWEGFVAHIREGRTAPYTRKA